MATASREHRALSAEETAEITQAYLKLSESTGQAVTDNVQAQKFFSENLQEMISTSGLAALKHAGIIDSTTQNKLKELKILKKLSRF